MDIDRPATRSRNRGSVLELRHGPLLILPGRVIGYHLRVELVVADPVVVLECPRFAIVESATWVNASDKFLKLAGTSDNAHDCFGGVLGVPQDAKTCGPSSSIGASF
jgi:hypothetical protein